MPPTMDPGHINRRAGADGCVPIFDIPAQKWKRVPQVDAREMVRVGSGCMFGPRVAMTRPDGSGRMEVCTGEVDQYRGQGYQVAAQDAAKVEELRNAEADPGAPTGDAVNWSKYNRGDLLTFASKAGLQEYEDFTKAQLGEALNATGFTPGAGPMGASNEDPGEDPDQE